MLEVVQLRQVVSMLLDENNQDPTQDGNSFVNHNINPSFAQTFFSSLVGGILSIPAAAYELRTAITGAQPSPTGAAIEQDASAYNAVAGQGSFIPQIAGAVAPFVFLGGVGGLGAAAEGVEATAATTLPSLRFGAKIVSPILKSGAGMAAFSAPTAITNNFNLNNQTLDAKGAADDLAISGVLGMGLGVFHVGISALLGRIKQGLPVTDAEAALAKNPPENPTPADISTAEGAVNSYTDLSAQNGKVSVPIASQGDMEQLTEDYNKTISGDISSQAPPEILAKTIKSDDGAVIKDALPNIVSENKDNLQKLNSAITSTLNDIKQSDAAFPFQRDFSESTLGTSKYTSTLQYLKQLGDTETAPPDVKAKAAEVLSLDSQRSITVQRLSTLDSLQRTFNDVDTDNYLSGRQAPRDNAVFEEDRLPEAGDPQAETPIAETPSLDANTEAPLQNVEDPSTVTNSETALPTEEKVSAEKQENVVPEGFSDFENPEQVLNLVKEHAGQEYADLDETINAIKNDKDLLRGFYSCIMGA